MTAEDNSDWEGTLDLDGWKWEKVYLPVKNWVIDVKVLDFRIEASSSISLDDIIIVEMDFSGNEEKLWQLERFIERHSLFHIFTLLSAKSWAQTRNIPCKVKFRWTLSKRCVSYFFQMVFGLSLLKLFSKFIK